MIEINNETTFVDRLCGDDLTWIVIKPISGRGYLCESTSPEQWKGTKKIFSEREILTILSTGSGVLAEQHAARIVAQQLDQGLRHRLVDVHAAPSYAEACERRAEEDRAFFASLNVGDIVHYHADPGYVRARAARVGPDSVSDQGTPLVPRSIALRPFALVGEWKTLASREWTRKIRIPTWLFRPSSLAIWERSSRSTDPRTMPELELEDLSWEKSDDHWLARAETNGRIFIFSPEDFDACLRLAAAGKLRAERRIEDNGELSYVLAKP